MSYEEMRNLAFGDFEVSKKNSVYYSYTHKMWVFHTGAQEILFYNESQARNYAATH